jgi:drug/metabolite transporter (DMT)-like permease
MAALLQSVRTAAQKRLTADISAEGATLVRYLFGLPFALLYLAVQAQGVQLPRVGMTFLLAVLAAGALQIIATILLIRLFKLRNFAVGSTYVRAEILVTALLGTALFSDWVSPGGWLAIIICCIGLLLVNLTGVGRWGGLFSRSAAYGIAASIAFSLTSLLIRMASLSLELDSAVIAAAMTLAVMVCIQTVMSLLLVIIRDKRELALIALHWKPSLFVGITGVIGSVGWFTAFTLERAAYVKTLGQVEFLISVLISYYFFKERPTAKEWTGMLFLVVGVVLLLISD